MFTPTNPVEPVTNIRILPAPSEIKILQSAVSKPVPAAEPKNMLQFPVVRALPANEPKARLAFPEPETRAQKPKAVLFIPVKLHLRAWLPIATF